MGRDLARNFIVGSEWLYYKIYTGYKTADLVLKEIINPISEQLKQEGIIDKWFFIRYADPKPHLRVRFHCKETSQVGQVIEELYKFLDQFVKQDLIWKIQLDTYNREIERYGENTMVLSETLFCIDSGATIKFLDLIEGDIGEKLRWMFALRAIDHFLNCFNYPLEAKLKFMEVLKNGFGQEFGMSRPLKKQLDDKYRTERKNVEVFMVFNQESVPEYEPILNILKTKDKSIKPIADQILDLNKNGNMEVGLDSLLNSHVHMLMNRLFKSKNRLNEMVCYDFLYRYYRSMNAREKG